MITVIWLTASMASYAQNSGYSADIELIRPRFGAGGIPGAQLPVTDGKLALRLGIAAQYERDPLTLYDAITDREQGAVVTNRSTADIGVSLDLSERVTVDGVLPVALSWGSEIADLAADGLGAGDFSVGTKVIGIKSRMFNAGIRGQLLLPTGRQDAYAGEAGIRGLGGLIASLDVGPARIATDAAVLGRQRLTTAEDFTLGSEIHWTSGARLALPAATRTAFTATLVSRVGLQDFLTGGAENALEALGGVQILPSQRVVVDFGAGRGITEGYGTTDLRLLSQITLRSPTKRGPLVLRDPPPPLPPEPPDDDIFITQLIDPLPEAPITVEPEVIKIRDSLDFIVNTAILLEQSLPTLAALADALFDHPEIAQVVIEGHASQEGTYEANYELSLLRAHAIWQELVDLGVDPNRLAFRPMGEVEPLTEGTSEAALQENRRVEFHIVQRHGPDKIPAPAIPSIPWSGEREPAE